MRQAIVPCEEILEMVIEGGAKDLLSCYQCGTCTASCPWGLVGHLGIRNMIRLAMLGQEGFEGEDVWKCTTCNTCVDRCPRKIEIIDIFRSVRSQLAEAGTIPRTLRTALSSITTNGNPWLGDRGDRTGWLKGLEVKHISDATTTTLYFTCCTPAYDPRVRRSAQAMVRVLQAAGVDFGILGAEASCCGDPSHRIGNLEQYESLAGKNLELFKKYGVKEIITGSPHCFNMFTKIYGEIGDIRVRSYTEVVAEALEKGRLKLSKSCDATVSYHDACYLGRHNGIYDPPRRILEAVPGVKFVEMKRNRENALCCGGGGGGIWMEAKKGERFSEVRVNEATEVGAGILATACPYCVVMLEDGVKSNNLGDALRVMDIAEIVAEAL
jgi:Fe-S oxidoreductase